MVTVGRTRQKCRWYEAVRPAEFLYGSATWLGPTPKATKGETIKKTGGGQGKATAGFRFTHSPG